MDKIFYAHSLPGQPIEKWQPLEEHLQAVAEKARDFASTFGLSDRIQFGHSRLSGNPVLILSGLLFSFMIDSMLAGLYPARKIGKGRYDFKNHEPKIVSRGI